MNASTPDDPGRDLDAEALSRVLDGLDLDADADDAERAAQTRAEDDVAAIMRAFAVMGDALAEPVAAADRAEAVVLPFATRLRKRAPILAAAASLLAVVGLGTVLVNNDNFSGRGDEDSATAQGSADAAADAPAAPPMPNASSAQRNSEAYDSANPLLSGESSAAAPAAKSAAGAADKGAPAAGEEERAAESTGTLSAPKSDTKAASARSALDVAVSCNRGVFIGRVLSVTPSGTRYTLRVTVTDWISPSSGAAVREFTVGHSYANTEDGRIDLKLGQEWLFVVPRSQDRAVRTFAGPDYSKAREQVAAAQERTADDAC